MSELILLTGATGHVGQALLPRLLADPQARALCLIRAKSPEELEKRRAGLVEKTGADGARVEAIAGDVAAPGLGLAAADRARVLAEATHVLHSAASVRFDMPQEAAAKQNIEAVESILALSEALAERGRLVRLEHVSTCYVAGDRRGLAREEECDEGQGFRNSYEWSKCRAEVLVRAARSRGLPLSIYRPAIVVGDSKTGATEAFNVLYWPLKLYARGWWRTFPGDPQTRVDVVPVDFVGDAIAALHRGPAAEGRCVHLAVGEDAPTVAELIEQVRAALGTPPIRFVDQGRYRKYVRPLLAPFFWTKRGKMIRRGGNAFLPYFTGNPVFDTTGARDLLGELRPPPVRDYLDTILKYAVEKDFGQG